MNTEKPGPIIISHAALKQVLEIGLGGQHTYVVAGNSIIPLDTDRVAEWLADKVEAQARFTAASKDYRGPLQATMNQFRKITHGFVTQIFDESGKCIEQNFTAGDPVEYETLNGDVIDEPNNEQYQPFNMLQPIGNISIEIKDGVVQEVDGLPDGWTYTLDDHDVEEGY